MFRRFRIQIASFVAAVALVVVVSSCTKDEPEGNGDQSKAPSAEVLAALAKADLADGKDDKVVGKCVSCKLAMEGSADHLVKVGDYSVHLCTADCKKNFEGDPDKALLALK